MTEAVGQGSPERLRSEIRTVRESILATLVRIDDILLQQIPQIRADYALKIGCWEQELLQAELAARRSRRRLALAQAQVNQGDAPKMDAIEEQLDQELEEWMVKAKQAQVAYERALGYLTGSRTMSRSQSEEFKRLYRKLAKRLHPDVHAGDEERASLFALVQAAYRNGNLEALRSLEVATRHLDGAEDDLDMAKDEALLAQELELARIEEKVVQERLRELEEGEEMRLGKLLADPEWVTKRTSELRRAIEEWERARRESDERLREIEEAFDGR